MDYRAALGNILALTNYERVPDRASAAPRFDLERVTTLLAAVGNPHLGPATVHVAGTKGKGSTSAMIAAALTMSGYVTGLFTSPHLHTFRERIRVDDELISEDDFAQLTERLWPHVERISRRPDHMPLTTFEVLTALGFLHFAARNVDMQVIEVGLGGRLDATNVVSPTVCVITSISYDHTELLGNTLGQIAGEKAGIVKPGVPVVSGPQHPEALEVIRKVCAEKGAPLTVVGQDVTWDRQEVFRDGQDVTVRGTVMGRAFQHLLRVPLLGAHQVENAATVMATLEALRLAGHPVPYDTIYLGIGGMKWPGRLERLQEHPTVVVDGMHNVDSAVRLRQAVQEYFTFGRLLVVLGVASDKDLDGIVRELAPVTAKAFGTAAKSPRATPPARIAEAFQDHGVPARALEGVAEAVVAALAEAQPDDLVLVTGSLYVVAEAREHALGIQPETYP